MADLSNQTFSESEGFNSTQKGVDNAGLLYFSLFYILVILIQSCIACVVLWCDGHEFEGDLDESSESPVSVATV